MWYLGVKLSTHLFVVSSYVPAHERELSHHELAYSRANHWTSGEIAETRFLFSFVCVWSKFKFERGCSLARRVGGVSKVGNQTAFFGSTSIHMGHTQITMYFDNSPFHMQHVHGAASRNSCAMSRTLQTNMNTLVACIIQGWCPLLVYFRTLPFTSASA